MFSAFASVQPDYARFMHRECVNPPNPHRPAMCDDLSRTNYKLGEEKLPLNSVEGHVASQIYGKQPGEWVFRRITPIAAILVWAGICEHRRGALAFSEPSS